MQSQSEAVTEELVSVFGDGVNFQVEPEPQGPTSNQAMVIAVGVVFGVVVPGLIVAVFVRYRHFASDRFCHTDTQFVLHINLKYMSLLFKT